MKKNFLYLFLLLLLFGFSESKSVIINGEMPYLKDSECTLSVRDLNSEKQIIAKTKSVDGKFTLKCEVDKPTYAYLGVPGGEIVVILEPGTISFVSKDRSWPVPSGTYYNDLLNGWRKSDDIKNINEQLSELDKMISAPDYSEQPESVQNNVKAKFRLLRNRAAKVEREYLQTLIDGDDYYARLFAIRNSYLYGGPVLELLPELENKIGKNGEIEYILRVSAQEKKQAEQSKKIEIGKNFLEVSGIDANGKNVSLSKVITENKYTLLEFWASWCSPCRKEIPHLKESYDLYRNKGFEIFSYSIDSNKEDWLKAEKAEALPWISVSGRDKDAVKSVSDLYVVKSIPMNLLIDKNGKIVAMNLRGDYLNEFLKNLLK